MPVFAYKAATNDGALSAGTLLADTARAARDLLRERGLSALEVIPQRSSAPAIQLPLLRRRHTGKVATLVGELATMLGVGVPLTEALDTLARHHRGNFKICVLQLRERVNSGASLASSMAEQPLLFDELSVAIVEVGENSGTLDTALTRLSDFKDRSLQIKSKLGTALLYPAVVLLMAVSVAIFLMTQVVPNLLAALLTEHRQLPWATHVVKGVSDLLLGHWLSMAAVAILICIAVRMVLSTPQGRRNWHAAQLRIPVVGELIRKQAVVRLATVLATLMRSGVPFVRAVEVAAKLTPNLVLRESLGRLCAGVGAGAELGKALERAGAFPPLLTQVFTVGQQSGRLEEMLDKLATDYDRQVATATARLTSLIEPLLILCLVVIVGFIAFATILPMLEAANVQ